MSQLTPEIIQDFITKVQAQPGYQADPKIRELVDARTAQLLELSEKDLDAVETLEQISRLIDEIRVGVDVVQGKKEVAKIDEGVGNPTQPLDIEAIRDFTELLMKLSQSYDDMVKTLEGFGFHDEPPSFFKVGNALKKLSPKMIKEILKFGKPTILITPAGSFASKIQAIDDHGKIHGVMTTRCPEGPTNALWGQPSSHMVVSIVDGVVAMPKPAYISDDLTIGKKMGKYEKEFAKHQLEVMDCHEGAMLFMQSLSNSHPIDDIHATDTVTYFNRKHLENGLDVTCGAWYSDSSLLLFRSHRRRDRSARVRCRPSVKIMEIDGPEVSPDSESHTLSSAEKDKAYLLSFWTRLDKNGFNEMQKDKFKTMIAGYSDSVFTAKSIDANFQQKSLWEVLREILAFDPEKLKEIAEFQQPTLLVTPNNSFAEKKTNMDRFRPFVHPSNGQLQGNACIADHSTTPYKHIGTPQKTLISIVDGAPHIPHIWAIPGNLQWGERKQAFQEYFADKGNGIRLINIHEAAVLQQYSLHDYQRSGKDVSKIVDYCDGRKNDTVSCLDDAYLKSSVDVAFSSFNSGSRDVRFSAGVSVVTAETLRARPSVPVLEY